MSLTVAGFGQSLNSLNGQYHQIEKTNHGRPVFERAVRNPTQKKSVVYYWDARDGPDMVGWWMAPEVGGEEVWTHNTSDSATPPPSGWRVPWHEKVDPNVRFTYTPSKGAKAEKPQTTTTVGFERRAEAGKGKGQKESQQKGKGGKDGKKGDGKGGKKGKESTTGVGGKGAEAAQKRREAAEQAQKEAQARRAKLEEQQQKAAAEQKEKVEKQEKEWTTALEKDFVESFKQCKSLFEEYKDATAVLTSDVADHLDPEDTIVAYKSGEEVKEKINKLKGTCQTLSKNITSSPIYRQVSVDLRNKLQELDKKLKHFGTQLHEQDLMCQQHVKKAKKKMAEMAKQQEIEKQREEKRKLQEWNQQIVGKAAEDVILGERAAKRAKKEEGVLLDAEKALHRASKQIQVALAEKGASEQTKTQLQGLFKRTRSSLDLISKEAKKRRMEIEAKNQVVVFQLLAKFKEMQVGGTDLFSMFAVDDKLTSAGFDKMVEFVNFEGDHKDYFKKCLEKAGKEDYLTKSGFELFCEKMYFRATQDAIMTPEEDPTQGTKTQLQADEIVSVEDIVVVEGKKRMKICRISEKTEGYIFETTKNGKPTLLPYSPLYTCVAETVITDKQELKGFRVVLRMKVGDEFVASGLPVSTPGVNLFRIQGSCNGTDGWTTIRGNQGTNYIKPIRKTEKKGDQKTEEMEVEPQSEEEKLGQLLALQEEYRAELSKVKTEVTEAVEALDAKSLELLALAESTPQEEEISKFKETVTGLFKTAQDKLTEGKILVITYSRELRQVKGGPLGDCHVDLQTYPEFLNELQEKTSANNKKATTTLKDLHDRDVARTKKEKEEEAQSKIAEMEEEMKVFTEQIQAEASTAEETLKVCGEDLEDVGAAIDKVTITMKQIKEWFTKANEVCKEFTAFSKVMAFKTKTLAEFRKSMMSERERILAVRSKRQALQIELGAKRRLSIGLMFKQYLKEKNLNAESIFDGAAEMDFSQFLAEARRAEISYPESTLQEVYEKIATPTLTLSEFKFICEPKMITEKQMAVTDSLSLKSGKKLHTLNLYDIVDVLSEPEYDEVAKVNRVKVQAKSINDGEEGVVEGYITLKSVNGTVFFKQLQPYWKVTKETVMTDILAMKGFKVVRRLKKDEIIKSTSPEEMDAPSSMLRLQGTAVVDKASGWVTIKGNSVKESQGMYLENFDYTPPKPKQQEEEEEQKEEDKSAKSLQEGDVESRVQEPEDEEKPDYGDDDE